MLRRKIKQDWSEAMVVTGQSGEVSWGGDI